MDILGIDIMEIDKDFIKRKYTDDDELLQLLKDSLDGNDEIFLGGPTYKFGDCLVHSFITYSPSGDVTGEILIKCLQNINKYMKYDCTIATSILFLDGHGSRFEECFLSYINPEQGSEGNK